MPDNDLSQQLQYGNDIYDFRVHPGVEETQGVPFVLVKDIQVLFPDASTFMCGRRVIGYMCDANYDSLTPLRFAYQHDMITIAKTKPYMSPTEMLPESSSMPSTSCRTGQYYSATLHRQLTRQNTAVLQVTSASPAEKDKFQQSAALFEDYVKALENGQKRQANHIQDNFSALQASLDRNHDLQQQLY
ncbi:hypothetical protein BGX24_001001, partial [Mortierella sp. AD032]